MAITEGERNKVTLLLENFQVPDPYYGNNNVFKKVFDLINNACERISNQLMSSQS
tara:strand:+ start:150 stop:314 length:165 start_codon:yes stop_codon:yes gene_type:complete